MKMVLFFASFLTSTSIAGAYELHAEEKRFFIKGYEVSVKSDGSRWIGLLGERRALCLVPGGEARFYDSSGKVLDTGGWDGKTGQVTGIEDLEHRRSELADVVLQSLRPDKIVETGADGNPFSPIRQKSASTAAEEKKKSTLEFL